MRTVIIAGLIAVVVIAAAALFAGCMEKNQVDAGQVQEYADPITEDILLAMNEDDYAKYSDNFDQTMRNAISGAVFNETNAMIKSKIGGYVSKEFQKAEGKDQYTIVYYNARFTDEPDDVAVKVVFQEINGEIKVSGLWLDSPKLRGK